MFVDSESLNLSNSYNLTLVHSNFIDVSFGLIFRNNFLCDCLTFKNSRNISHINLFFRIVKHLLINGKSFYRCC